MKVVFAAVAMIVLASCGRIESPSHVESMPVGLALGFEKDLRPVDGNLTTLTIIQNSEKYATVTITTVGLLSNVKKVNKLGDKFVCKTEGKFRLNLDCRVDLRPVDGALTILSVVETSPDSFEAKLTHKYVDRRTGKEIVTTDEIESRMTRKYIPSYLAR